MTLTLYWWVLPLIITIVSFIPAANYKPRDYDPGGAILALIGLCVSVTAWLVAIITRVVL